MSTFLLAALLSLGQVELTVDVANGTTISGFRTFRATVVADDPITQVEFYVGDELRDSDSSIPYEFKLDTIEENDGDLTLTFAAYTNKGDSSKKIVRVTVDNGISKGADFHAQKAMELVQDSRWDDAILSGRIALKADPKNNAARMAMARAYMGKGAWDQAQRYAEDFYEDAPNDLEARGLVAGINTLRALRTFDRGTDRAGTLVAIREALKTAIDARRKTLEERLDAMGAVTDANVIDYVDLALRANRYSIVIQTLTPRVRRDMTDNRLVNRLALAQLSGGRQPDALQTLNQAEKFGKLDSYGLAMKSALHNLIGDRVASDNYLKEAVLSDQSDIAVRSAQIFLAVRSSRLDAAAQLLTPLLRDEGQRAEAQYYGFLVLNSLGQYDQGRQYFEQAILTDPLLEPVYIEQAKKTVALAVDGKVAPDSLAFHFDAAEGMFQAAYDVRPESFQAMAGLAICQLLRNEASATVPTVVGDLDKALSYAEAAVRAAPTEAAGHFILSVAQDLQSKKLAAEGDQFRIQAVSLRTSGNAYAGSEAEKSASLRFARSSRLRDAAMASVRKAGELDQVRLGGQGIPRPVHAWRYLHWVRQAVFPAPR